MVKALSLATQSVIKVTQNGPLPGLLDSRIQCNDVLYRRRLTIFPLVAPANAYRDVGVERFAATLANTHFKTPA